MALVMISCLPKSENANELLKTPSPLNEKSDGRASSRFQPSPVGKSSPPKRGMDNVFFLFVIGYNIIIVIFSITVR